MSDPNFYRGSENLLKTSKLIRAVYAPLERKNPNVQNFLLNYTKIVRDSIDQLTGSKAIEIPTTIEANDEVALASPETIRQYSAYLVLSADPGFLDCQDQREAARHRSEQPGQKTSHRDHRVLEVSLIHSQHSHARPQ